MVSLRLHSIGSRLRLLAAVAILTCSAIMLAVTVWQGTARYVAMKKAALFATADVMAAAAGRGVVENDREAAYRALRSVSSVGDAVHAAIVVDGRVVAEAGAVARLGSDLVLRSRDETVGVAAALASRTMEVDVPVVYGGRTVASLVLVASIEDLRPALWQMVRATLIGGLVAAAVAMAAAWRLQRALTRPIEELSGAVTRITENHDYVVTLPTDGDDEVGRLVAGFNRMLVAVHERDETLARHRAKLEQDVADRTADFRAAAKAAEEANRAKSDFLATMSHEIRTPMNGILVMAEVLASEDLPAKARRQAEVIARSGSSLLAIINDILDLSKVEAGKLTVEMLPVDPVEIGDGVARLFADHAASKGLDLATVVRLPPGTRVAADPTRLGQVLGNLVNNALKFTAEGGVAITVAPDGPGRVRFAVEDSGIGIPADKLGTIFEAFAQADQSTTRHYGGTGLGLSIARQLVAAMGGTLSVTSTVGRGSTFAFTLAEAAAPAAVTSSPRAATPVLARLAVDRPQTAAALRAALEAAGIAELDPAAEDAGAARLVRFESGGADPAGGAGRRATIRVRLASATATAGAETELAWPLARAEVDRLLARVRDGRSLTEETAPPAAVSERFDGLRVLVADDAEVNREVVDAALRRLGIRPAFVVDGRAAVAAVLAERFDLVLMDGSMPEMDGFEATRAIRAAEDRQGLRRTPIVALTAHVVGTAADAWKSAGMDGILHKPFTLAALARCLGLHADRVAAPPEDWPAQAAPADEAAAALDHAVLSDLLEMSGGAVEVVDRIIRLYQVRSREALGRLRAAQAAAAADEVARIAHALKSMSLNVGARLVGESCAAIERAARNEAAIVADGELAALEALRAAVDRDLDAWLSDVRSAA